MNTQRNKKKVRKRDARDLLFFSAHLMFTTGSKNNACDLWPRRDKKVGDAVLWLDACVVKNYPPILALSIWNMHTLKRERIISDDAT